MELLDIAYLLACYLQRKNYHLQMQNYFFSLKTTIRIQSQHTAVYAITVYSLPLTRTDDSPYKKENIPTVVTV